MTGQQFVEISSIPLGEACRLAHVSHGDLQYLGQVISREFIACV